MAKNYKVADGVSLVGGGIHYKPGDMISEENLSVESIAALTKSGKLIEVSDNSKKTEEKKSEEKKSEEKKSEEKKQ